MARVLIFCQDHIGTKMAGPGIRSYEFARTLSAEHEVTLAAPNRPDIVADQFKIVCQIDSTLGTLLPGQDVVISQQITPRMSYVLRKTGGKLILDAYDPVALEELEQPGALHTKAGRVRHRRLNSIMQLWLTLTDSLICASEKQRDLWIGALMALGRIDPRTYAHDRSLRRLIDVVPFGLPKEPPSKTGPGFRRKLGISDQDKVLLWAGGIWDWFDPLTLIRSIGLIAKHRPDVKLVFMGTQRPNAEANNMQMYVQARDLTRSLGLEGTSVFFNEGWVPYDERHNHLLEADAGVSTHFDHLETRFSFRTRILDYLWAGLPIVCTEGDSMAELVATEQLGTVAPYEDHSSLASAIVSVLEPERSAGIRERIRGLAPQFTWDEVTRPLDRMISEPNSTTSDAKRRALATARYYPNALAAVIEQRGLWETLTKIGPRFGSERLKGIRKKNKE